MPLKPDEVEVKSRKNVWWRCSKCGNGEICYQCPCEGTVCPVCAEREVLADIMIWRQQTVSFLANGIMNRNKLKPTEVLITNFSKGSVVEMQAQSFVGMKINERTILKKGCRFCEQEYLSLFPALAVNYYSNKKSRSQNLVHDRLLEFRLKHTCLQKSWLLSQEVPMRI